MGKKKHTSSANKEEYDDDTPDIGDRVYISPFYSGCSTKYDGKYAVIISKSKTRYRLHVEGLINRGLYRWCHLKDAKKVPSIDAKKVHAKKVPSIDDKREDDTKNIVNSFEKQLKLILRNTHSLAQEKDVVDAVKKKTLAILIQALLEEQQEE